MGEENVKKAKCRKKEEVSEKRMFLALNLFFRKVFVCMCIKNARLDICILLDATARIIRTRNDTKFVY